VVLIEDLAFSTELPKQDKYATIMFDDGYKDNIDYAAPILEKYGCKASFYVVTDCIDKNIPTWTHVLDHTFQYTHINTIDLAFDFFPQAL
jgi:peptidoglycan/xylan/chitin deacetylase (PgdA/CDA1 family)